MRIITILASFVVLVAATACGGEDPVAPVEAGFTKVPSAGTGGRPLYAELLPAGDPDGSGTALITLNHGQGEICWEVTASNVTLPSGLAHIHGPFPSAAVVFPFPGPDATGASTGCGDSDRSLIKDILQSPGSYFVNLHHPDTGGSDVTGFLSK